MKRIILSLLATVLCSFAMLSVTAPALVAADSPEDSAKAQACAGIGETGTSCGDSTGFDSIVQVVVDVLSFIVGIIAVIMLIIAGLKYVTSGGESGKLTSAKSTIIYALVGLVIVALAQFIVHFAFNEAVSTQCKSDPTISASDAACK